MSYLLSYEDPQKENMWVITNNKNKSEYLNEFLEDISEDEKGVFKDDINKYLKDRNINWRAIKVFGYGRRYEDDIKKVVVRLAKITKVNSLEYQEYSGNVHDLTIENTHSYNIEGIAVHNSAAGSLVAYLTDITSVNPLDYDLMFERFHNKEKKSFPDIDTDFSSPDLVKEYLKSKYGADRVASISNWSTMSPKVVIKDVARSLRLGGSKSSAFQIANAITDIMPDADTVQDAYRDSPEFAKYMRKYPKLYEYAKKLQGINRNWSIHAAGVIIGDRPLYETVPLRIDPISGLVATQWEKKRCEENGYVKIDFLGLKTLDVIDDTFRNIRQSQGISLGLEDIELNEPETCAMLGRGETAGVFQLESSLTPLCMKIKPKNIEEISAINALGRPSCLPEVRQKYIRRALKEGPVSYDHPNLERALSKTNGILLYEESAMAIAKDCAEWDLNEADALRKISKLKGKDPELVERTHTKFIEDVMKHSKMSRREAQDLWEDYIVPLGRYSFNKSLHFSTPLSIIRNNENLTIPIEQAQPGDLIRTRSEDDSREFYTEIVENHYHGKLSVYEVELESGEKISCTMNHKFRTTDGRMLPLWWILRDNLDIVVSAEKS